METAYYVKLVPISERSRKYTFNTLECGNIGKFSTKYEAFEILISMYVDDLVSPSLFCDLYHQIEATEDLLVIPRFFLRSLEELGLLDWLAEEATKTTEELSAFVSYLVKELYPYAACEEDFLPFLWVDDTSDSYHPVAYVLMRPPKVEIVEDRYSFHSEELTPLTSRIEAREYIHSLLEEEKILLEDFELLSADIEYSDLPESKEEFPKYVLN